MSVNNLRGDRRLIPSPPPSGQKKSKCRHEGRSARECRESVCGGVVNPASFDCFHLHVRLCVGVCGVLWVFWVLAVLHDIFLLESLRSLLVVPVADSFLISFFKTPKPVVLMPNVQKFKLSGSGAMKF
mmetsp:Transcript_17169/g.47159  ORF Transcript_17169/g.47159 Transcript_17169/m.47159 type:complete len:128 (+) Transcript_17169:47-430(+)